MSSYIEVQSKVKREEKILPRDFLLRAWERCKRCEPARNPQQDDPRPSAPFDIPSDLPDTHAVALRSYPSYPGRALIGNSFPPVHEHLHAVNLGPGCPTRRSCALSFDAPHHRRGANPRDSKPATGSGQVNPIRVTASSRVPIPRRPILSEHRLSPQTRPSPRNPTFARTIGCEGTRPTDRGWSRGSSKTVRRIPLASRA